MAPLLLKVKGNKSFSPFSNLTDQDSLTRTWRVCTKVAHLEQGQRLENLSWRLWYLHDLMVENDDNKSKRDFKRLSRSTGEKLDRDKGRSIEQLTAPGFRRTDSGDAVRRRAAEREKLRALAVAKLQGKFKGKQSMKAMQYTFAVDPSVNFKRSAGDTTAPSASAAGTAAVGQQHPHGFSDACDTRDAAAAGASTSGSDPLEDSSGNGGGNPADNAMDVAMDDASAGLNTASAAAADPPTQIEQAFSALSEHDFTFPSGFSYNLADIEAEERELLANQIDLNAPLETLLAGLEGVEDVQMDLTDMGLAAGTQLPSFNAPFDAAPRQQYVSFAVPPFEDAAAAASRIQQPNEAGRGRQPSVAAKQQKVTKKQRKTDPQQQKIAAELVRKKAEEVRTARKLADATQRTHIHAGSKDASPDRQLSAGVSAGSGSGSGDGRSVQWALPGQGPTQGPRRQASWDKLNHGQAHPTLSHGGYPHGLGEGQPGGFGGVGGSGFASLSAMASATESAHSFENASGSGSNSGGAPLQISTSFPSTVSSGSTGGFTAASSSTPSTPLFAGHMAYPPGPDEGCSHSVDSLSAPTSPTSRPALSAFGRSGSSPGPPGFSGSTAAASAAAAKRHSTDGGVDQASKPRGRGRRSLIGANAFTAIHPGGGGGGGSAADRKSFSSDSQPAAAQCTNCGATSTPLWRRDPNDLLLCNACGLFLKLHKTPRPKSLKNNHHSHSHSGHATPSATPGGASAPGSRNVSPSQAGSPSAEEMMSCHNCGTFTTPLWRKDDAGHTVCNACGLYLKLHHEHRPATMRADVIKKRSRYDEKRGRASAASSRRSSPQPGGGLAESSGSAWASAAAAAGGQSITATGEGMKTEPNDTALGDGSLPLQSYGIDGQHAHLQQLAQQQQQQQHQSTCMSGFPFQLPLKLEDSQGGASDAPGGAAGRGWPHMPFTLAGGGGGAGGETGGNNPNAFAAIMAQFGLGLANLSQSPQSQMPPFQPQQPAGDSCYPSTDWTMMQAVMQGQQALLAAQTALGHHQQQQQQQQQSGGDGYMSTDAAPQASGYAPAGAGAIAMAASGDQHNGVNVLEASSSCPIAASTATNATTGAGATLASMTATANYAVPRFGSYDGPSIHAGTPSNDTSTPADSVAAASAATPLGGGADSRNDVNADTPQAGSWW